LYAAGSETFKGAAADTYKRPQLIVDGKLPNTGVVVRKLDARKLGN
jgi:hypothetical protein